MYIYIYIYIGWVAVDWLSEAQDREEWWAVVNW